MSSGVSPHLAPHGVRRGASCLAARSALRHSARRFGFAGLLAVSAWLWTSTPGHAAALDQFKSFVSTTKSAKGAFTQRLVKAEPEGAAAKSPPRSTQSSGTFSFARPGKFSWKYEEPYEQLLQSNGEKLYIYDKDLNQVTVRKLGDALGSSPAAILFGSNDLEKNFTLKEAGSRDGLEWLEAVPKAQDTSFERIAIGLRNGVPEAMELRDSFGQVSMLSFTRFEKNPPIPAGAFAFSVPKGADVFEQ